MVILINHVLFQIALLQKESEVPIEELLARYKKVRRGVPCFLPSVLIECIYFSDDTSLFRIVTVEM